MNFPFGRAVYLVWGHNESLDSGINICSSQDGDQNLSKGPVSTAANSYSTFMWILKNALLQADAALPQGTGMVNRVQAGLQPSHVLFLGAFGQ